MTGLLLVAAAWAAPPALVDDYQEHRGPVAPPSDGGVWNLVDIGEIAVLRPSVAALGPAFSNDAFDQTMLQALAGRSEVPDVALMTHTDALPVTFTAGAFHRAYNNADVWGTGDDPVLTPEIPVRSGIWMNTLGYWDFWGAEYPTYPDYVFCHEVGHQWLAFAQIPVSEGDAEALLGRQRAHWSYWASTDNSPMEGNAWVDNGDGTWTTDLSVASVFAPMDLYLMGLEEADAVPPLTLLEPLEPTVLHRESTPQHKFSDEAFTVQAAASSWTIDQLIDANGDWRSTLGYTAANLDVLMVLVLAPEERLTDDLLRQAESRRQQWLSAWQTCTGGRSELHLGTSEDGPQLPPPPEAPTFVPLGVYE